MTAVQKRNTVVDAVKSREGKNQYTQTSKRTQVGSGFGDCSSTMQWAYNKLGINIGDHTESQILSKTAHDVDLDIVNGLPDESRMRPGDLLYFRGASSIHKDRSRNVGHVEMYVGNGQISGHPSGIGPTRKDMKDYCTKMQNKYSAYASPKNCGLICVRRAVDDDEVIRPDPDPLIRKGSQVYFHGTRHYKSSDGPSYNACLPCKAEVTAVSEGAPYPYHVKGDSVWGWVPASDITLQKTGTLICTSLHIRQKPDASSVSLGIMKNGDTFDITGSEINGWYPIIWKGKAGYAKNSPSYMTVA